MKPSICSWKNDESQKLRYCPFTYSTNPILWGRFYEAWYIFNMEQKPKHWNFWTIKFYYSVKVWICILWNNLYISTTPILYCRNFNINQQMAYKEAKFLTLSRWQRSCLSQNFQATCCGGGIVVVLKMILIWEFRVPGILIWGERD